MQTKALHEMTLPELRQHRQRAKIDLVRITYSATGTSGKDRIEIEEAATEQRDYIRTIEARIARLERVVRN